MIAIKTSYVPLIPADIYPPGFTPADLREAIRVGLRGWADMDQPVRITDLPVTAEVSAWLSRLVAQP